MTSRGTVGRFSLAFDDQRIRSKVSPAILRPEGAILFEKNRGIVTSRSTVGRFFFSSR